MHELSEGTKKLLDAASFLLAGVAAGFTLANIALVVTIIAGALSAAWTAMRFYDRLRFGPDVID